MENAVFIYLAKLQSYLVLSDKFVRTLSAVIT